jgi:hypothetical protein
MLRSSFEAIAKPNYYEFILCNQTDVRRLWNAVVSMSSVADYLALAQLDHRVASRQELQDLADDIREEHGLEDLALCADTLKHLRKTGGSRANPSVTGTSTNVSSDTATWVIDGLNVVDVLRRAFEKLKEHPDLK